MKFSSYTSAEPRGIRDLFVQTFSVTDGEHEGKLIGNLAMALMNQAEPKNLVGFVAQELDRLVGCIFFSPMVFEQGATAYLLAPVAIATERQGQGIGQKLIRFGLGQLRSKGAEWVFTYGDPAFYSKLGFEPICEALAEAPFILSQPHGWQYRPFATKVIDKPLGKARCVEPFNNPEYW